MSDEFRSLCVFCGSSPGRVPAYRDAAVRLGRLLARRRIRVVYGGAHVGLMGALADAALTAGGRVVGVIPRQLVCREVAHVGLSELHVVESMHERKALMADLSDGFVALPGGFGTLEETFETLTWSQLGIHAKPTGLLNVAGYFDGLVGFVDQAVRERFIRTEHRALVQVAADPVELLAAMAAAGVRASAGGPAAEKWIDRTAT